MAKNKSAADARRERRARMRVKVGAKPISRDAGTIVIGEQADDTRVDYHSWEEKKSAPPETWYRCCKCERAYQRKDVIEVGGVLLCAFQCGAGFLPHGEDWNYYRDMFAGLDLPEIPIYGEYYE